MALGSRFHRRMLIAIRQQCQRTSLISSSSQRSSSAGHCHYALASGVSQNMSRCVITNTLQRSEPVRLQQRRPMHEGTVSRLCIQKSHTLPLRDDRLAQVRLEEGGKSLHVGWESGAESSYSSLWIRHHDRSEKTFNRSANQLFVNHADLPTDVTLTHASVAYADDSESIVFSTGDFQGFIPSHLLKEVEWLRHESFSLRNHELGPPCIHVPRLKFDPSNIPELRAAIYHQLIDHGWTVVDTESMQLGYLNEFTQKVLDIPIFETTYGRIFDVVTKPTPDNVAYTNIGLDLHQDLTYFESPPGLQLLHCLSNECEGGDSTIVDAIHVAETMRERHPDSFQVLCTVPVFNQKIVCPPPPPSNGVPQNKDSQPRGQPQGNGVDQRTRRTPEPANPVVVECVHLRRLQHMIKLNDKHEVVDVRSTYFTEGPWIMPREKEVPFLMAYKIFHQMLKHDEFMQKFRLQAGQILVMNNRRMMHGRTQIELPSDNNKSAVRHLQGCYVNIDMFRSKAICIAEQMLGAERQEPRVGNGDLL